MDPQRSMGKKNLMLNSTSQPEPVATRGSVVVYSTVLFLHFIIMTHILSEDNVPVLLVIV